MKTEHYFYNCSKEYIASVGADLYSDIVQIVDELPKREKQAQINQDFFWLLTEKGWAYDKIPSKTPLHPPADLKIPSRDKNKFAGHNERSSCKTSTTLNVGWHADFAKFYDGRLVQLEVQFGTVESMFKDFCGFRVATFEKRLALGIEVVLIEPGKYFSHRKSSVGGMAYFDVARRTLSTIGLDCPIWLTGIK